MNRMPPKQRSSFISSFGLHKNSIVAGIILGGVLGSVLGMFALRVIRGPSDEYAPVEEMPLRVVPPRPKPPQATPSPSAAPVPSAAPSPSVAPTPSPPTDPPKKSKNKSRKR